MEVFGHYGYEGTSLQNLLDDLGIARQSLYDTYGTKRDLFISAVKQYADQKTSLVIWIGEGSYHCRFQRECCCAERSRAE